MILPSIFRRPAFALMWAGRMLNVMALVMQSVAIVWLFFSGGL
jgi:hypothetical protein